MNGILIYDLNYKMTESPLGFVDAGIKSLLRITIVIKTTKEIYDIKERNKNAKLERTWMYSLWYSFTPAYLVFNCSFFLLFLIIFSLSCISSSIRTIPQRQIHGRCESIDI